MLAADTKAAEAFLAAASSPEAPVSWKQIAQPVEPFLRAVSLRLAEQVQAFEPEVASYARYALTNQGKQLRPALVALSAEATGGLNDELVTVATIIEMVHLATLVHDDVMDEARLRRRRPTLAARCGNTLSVLVGDCLFAQALRLAAGFPTTEVCRAVSSATKTVCSGEILQSAHEHRLTTTREEYFRVLRMKTAELFALSCELGAGLSGASGAERSALREYGTALGTAYQIYDDCLDLFGSEADAGKSLGTDLVGGKITLPILVTLERAGEADRRRLEGLLLDWEPARLPRLREMMHAQGALAEAAEVIQEWCRAARAPLTALSPGEGRQSLAAATHFIAQQTELLGTSA
jgi:octaprenyl-diphosphate synthase